MDEVRLYCVYLFDDVASSPGEQRAGKMAAAEKIFPYKSCSAHKKTEQGSLKGLVVIHTLYARLVLKQKNVRTRTF